MAETLDVDTSYVQRDYIHGWLLSRLFEGSSLEDRLVLKGGNCLRKGYFEGARYSRDLDFTTATGVSDDELHSSLNDICEQISLGTGVEFDTERTLVRAKRGADDEKAISEARVYFNDFYGNESKLILSVRLDVSQFDRLYLPVQQRQLIHPYSDIETCATTIRCVKLEELLASKMRCLLQRRNIGDLFDLVYSMMINPDMEIARTEVISTFFRITIFRSRPEIAKGLLTELPFESLERAWGKYVICPLSTRFDFKRAKSAFLELLDLLLPGHSEIDFDPVFFPASMRTPIMEAAASQTLLKITYNGRERLCEPYELKFNRRKSDGHAREYLYVYDQTGGSHSAPSIKTFVSQNTQSIETTDIPFEPRVAIELNKAGGSETEGEFESKGRAAAPFARKRPKVRRRSIWSRRSTPFSSASAGPSYKVQCPYCGKRFSRKKPDTKLNKHKDKYGNPCFGRIGHLVY